MSDTPARIRVLSDITEDTVLDRRMLSACFDTQHHADIAWETYQKLVRLVAYVHGADTIPQELEVLREIDTKELGHRIDGLTIGGIIRLADMAEHSQVFNPVHAERSCISWYQADMEALTHLSNTLRDNLTA